MFRHSATFNALASDTPDLSSPHAELLLSHWFDSVGGEYRLAFGTSKPDPRRFCGPSLKRPIPAELDARAWLDHIASLFIDRTIPPAPLGLTLAAFVLTGTPLRDNRLSRVKVAKPSLTVTFTDTSGSYSIEAATLVEYTRRALRMLAAIEPAPVAPVSGEPHRPARPAPHPTSLAATDGAARCLYKNLIGILDWFECLRQADFDEPGNPKPPWWDRFDRDADWTIHLGHNRSPITHEARVGFACHKAQLAIAYTGLVTGGEDRWAKLTDPIRKTPELDHHLKACHAALRNLYGALSGAQSGPRLHYGVVPDERHLEAPVPGTWPGPEPESDAEKAAEDVVIKLACQRASKGNKDARLAAQFEQAKAERLRLRDERYQRNDQAEAHAKNHGLVTPDVLRQIEYAREHWREAIIDWKLRVAAVEALVDHLAAPVAGHQSEPSRGVQAPTQPTETPPPALTLNQQRVLRTMAIFDPTRLLSVEVIAAETGDPDSRPPQPRLSPETVRLCVAKLRELELVERPEGDRSGARLTLPGRRLAGKIAD